MFTCIDYTKQQGILIIRNFSLTCRCQDIDNPVPGERQGGEDRGGVGVRPLTVKGGTRQKRDAADAGDDGPGRSVTIITININ